MNDVLNFIFPAKLRRLNYVIRILLSLGMTYSVLSPEEIKTAVDGIDQLQLETTKVLAILFILLYQAVYIFVPRMTDAGLRRWLVILIAVPYVSFILTCLLAFLPTRLGPEESANSNASK